LPRRRISPRSPPTLEEPKPPTPPADTTDPETNAEQFSDWKNYYDVSSKQRKFNVTFDDRKDPRHPLYLYEQTHRNQRHRTTASSSKDTANLEAVEDPELVPSTARDIPSHATSEALPLDATAREDTMREDAPLATSHDTSLSPSRSDDAMPGGLTDSCALMRARTYDSRDCPDDYPFYL
jgi:hypothetical protein